jgi:Sulfatase
VASFRASTQHEGPGRAQQSEHGRPTAAQSEGEHAETLSAFSATSCGKLPLVWTRAVRNHVLPLIERGLPTLTFFAAWAFLNAVVNARYPDDEPAFWYLIPSSDVVMFFAYFAFFAWSGWRVPAVARVVLVVFLFVVRLIRLGDGVQTRYFGDRFNLYSDLPLIPEGVRFAHSTLAAWKFWALLLLVVGGLYALGVVSYRALVFVERYFTVRRHVGEFVAVTAVFLALSFVHHDPSYRELYLGGFGASAFPRLRYELKFLLNVYGYKTKNLEAIADVQEELSRTPSNLAKLDHKNVFLFLIESYGATVFERPFLRERARPALDALEAELGRRGFSIASSELRSPTYGGHSWLAQMTLSTGVRTESQLQYELMFTRQPKPMAAFFHDAGYRTVVAQPGTTRDWPKGEIFRFDQHYYARQFDYAGPGFAWAPMPDQYVLDFMRRRELASHPGPMFVEYVLISSHAPWSEQPALVDDWNRIGNGALYRELDNPHYPIEWPNFENASEAYIHSIVYDFEVLKRFFAEYVVDDTLVILIGDHQPVTEITDHSPSYAVPIHVLSRNERLVEPFRNRGYTSGMWPRRTEQPAPLERFLIDFLRDFSVADATPEVANFDRAPSSSASQAGCNRDGYADERHIGRIAETEVTAAAAATAAAGGDSARARRASGDGDGHRTAVGRCARGDGRCTAVARSDGHRTALGWSTRGDGRRTAFRRSTSRGKRAALGRRGRCSRTAGSARSAFGVRSTELRAACVERERPAQAGERNHLSELHHDDGSRLGTMTSSYMPIVPIVRRRVSGFYRQGRRYARTRCNRPMSFE